MCVHMYVVRKKGDNEYLKNIQIRRRVEVSRSYIFQIKLLFCQVTLQYANNIRSRSTKYAQGTHNEVQRGIS